MRKAANILFLLFCCLSGFAQEGVEADTRRQPYLQLNFHTGSFWTQSVHLEEQFNDPYKAIELRFGYHQTGTVGATPSLPQIWIGDALPAYRTGFRIYLQGIP